MNEQEGFNKFRISFVRDSKSLEAMSAPQRMKDPYISSLTALRKAIVDLRKERTADMNVIMNALPHLSMDGGWKLAVRIDGDNYYQFSRFYAHNPLTKVKKVAGKLLGVDVENDEFEEFNPIRNSDPKTNLFKRVHLDGRKESFWEALLLSFASEQYYLGWHANYNVKRIITSVETFPAEIEGLTEVEDEKVYGLLDQWTSNGSLEICNKMLKPDVVLKDDSAEITFAYFSPFGGLASLRVVCKREPFTIVESSRQGGFMYNCGIMY